MALFKECMSRAEKQAHALNVVRLGSPLSDDERDEITALLFLDGLTWNEYHSAANKKMRLEKRAEELAQYKKELEYISYERQAV